MSRHDAGLSLTGTNLADYTVGISLGNIQELVTSCSLIVCTGSIDHVAQVVQLMAEEVLSLPALLARPMVRMFRINGTGGIEIAVRLLGSSDNVQHRVYIGSQFLVWIGL